MTPYNGKCKKSTNVIFYILIFVKIRPVRTKVTHRQTHTHTEMDRPVAIGEILQIFLKCIMYINYCWCKFVTLHFSMSESNMSKWSNMCWSTGFVSEQLLQVSVCRWLHRILLWNWFVSYCFCIVRKIITFYNL